MTLLESMVALVVLGLAGVGFLEVFQGSARSTGDASTWIQAVAFAEASMEESKLGGPVPGAGDASLPGGFTRAIDVRPWLGARDVELVTVTVTMPGGGAFVLRRLSRAR